VGTCTRTEQLEQAVHQIEGEFVSFRILARLFKSHYQMLTEPLRQREVPVMIPTTLVVYFAKDFGKYMHHQVDSW
jgi:hypothetical protein